MDARAFCLAHRLSEGDTELVTWLVEQHLRMSVTAQKQDISDPEVIHRFATLVGTRERLDYLYLLTCADIAGTSPKLWNAWKDRLLADLYFAARRALREGLEHPPPREERLREARESARTLMQAQGHDDATIDRQFAGMPDENFLRFRPEQLAWQAASLIEVQIGQTLVKARRAVPDNDALEVFVYSPDRDGLFSAIVATLDRKGYGIHRARVLDAPHDAIFDVFEVLPQDSSADGDPQRLAAALRQVLAGDLLKVRPSRRAVPRQLRHFRFARGWNSAKVPVAGAPASAWWRLTARACWPTWRTCYACSTCACTTPALPPSASAPKTSSRSPTSTIARCPMLPGRRYAMRCAPVSTPPEFLPESPHEHQEACAHAARDSRQRSRQARIFRNAQARGRVQGCSPQEAGNQAGRQHRCRRQAERAP